jgi:hypothetical protein
MARPPANAPRSGTHRALAKLPKPPKSLTKDQAEVYDRYGLIMVEAGTLTATDLPALEDAARVRATLDEMYRDADASRATIAAFSRLHKELLVQLGLTPAARRAVQRADAPPDAEGDRLRNLLG